jgi:hypothetical protein
MEPELMPEWEENLYGTFGVKRVKVIDRGNVIALHQAIEKFTGEKYKPAEKSLKEKIEYIVKLADNDGEWDARLMQSHLFFFHKKDFHVTAIGKALKKIAKGGLLIEVARGVYRKEGK